MGSADGIQPKALDVADVDAMMGWIMKDPRWYDPAVYPVWEDHHLHFRKASLLVPANTLFTAIAEAMTDTGDTCRNVTKRRGEDVISIQDNTDTSTSPGVGPSTRTRIGKTQTHVINEQEEWSPHFIRNTLVTPRKIPTLSTHNNNKLESRVQEEEWSSHVEDHENGGIVTNVEGTMAPMTPDNRQEDIVGRDRQDFFLNIVNRLTSPSDTDYEGIDISPIQPK